MIKCDYCGRTQEQVPKIITGGNGSAICGDCVLTCMQIILEGVTTEYEEIKFPKEKKLIRNTKMTSSL